MEEVLAGNFESEVDVLRGSPTRNTVDVFKDQVSGSSAHDKEIDSKLSADLSHFAVDEAKDRLNLVVCVEQCDRRICRGRSLGSVGQPWR